MRDAHDLRRTVAEALGTYFLVLIGPGASMVNAYTHGAVGHVGVSLAFAFIVIALVFTLGHLSGAHLNPAVTLGFWSVGRFPGSAVGPYMAAQVVGAIAASFTLRYLLGPVGALGATLPLVGTGRALVIELLLSFALMLVIMAVATDDRVADGFAPIAVGLTVGFCALTGGPLTGASMNPARSLGPAVASGLWQGHWLYWIAPMTGMVAAARVYEALRPASVHPPSNGSALGVQGSLDR